MPAITLPPLDNPESAAGSIDKGKEREAVPSQSTSSGDEEPEEEDYEELRRRTIARNKDLMAAITGGMSFDKLFSKDGGLKVAEPVWMLDAKGYLEGVCEMPAWKALVDTWVELEGALGYPDGQVRSVPFSDR